jgi:cysteinyl-tRNA synthetase
MKLYNTRTLKVEEFKPINEGVVNMYVCGPTVYNHVHIGNARPMIVFDTLRRLFEANDLKVNYVSNFTDVDDKIINRAIEEKTTEKVITEKYINAYNMVKDSLNIKELKNTPKVTDTMDEIIDFIDRLIKNGNAYVVDGDVYFRVNSVKTYGEISHQNIDDLKVGARIESNSKKESPLDFALWKKTNQGIQWKTSFSTGRPGWHTECVVMINENFGSYIDIHGGGMDLRFPHHENEAAQARALYGTGLANFWMHNAMINFGGKKMSKSLGNVKWAKDVISELGPNLTRWFMLSVNYRKELQFCEETIETSRVELEKVSNPLFKAYIKCELNNYKLSEDYDIECFQSFLDAMNDDLNTPNAYAAIFESIKLLNQQLRVREINFIALNKYIISIEKMLEILGIKINRVILDDEDRALYLGWDLAKKNKDYESADKYRNKLLERGKM